MTLIEQLTEIFKKALTKVFKKESEKKWFLPQTILGCRFRAFCGISVAVAWSFKEMVKLLALSIAKHRTEDHGDNKGKTIETLSRSLDMSVSEVESSSFWN